MREITYIIDDKKGFERILKKEDLDEKDFFQVKYTLTKDASGITYKLVDFKNNSININSLNGINRCIQMSALPLLQKIEMFLMILKII